MRKISILGGMLSVVGLLVLASSCVVPSGASPFQQPQQGQPNPYQPGSQQPYPYGGPGVAVVEPTSPPVVPTEKAPAIVEPTPAPETVAAPGGGWGSGMMGGGWGNYNPDPNAKPITMDQAAESAQRYVGAYYGGRLAVAEVMEFARNFYAEVEEKDTGIHAVELLIDKYTGEVSPEMGPNMMWNSKYSPMSGMMGNYGGAPATVMPVTPEQARELAQQFLNANLPGVTVAEADTFYGYYTLHTLANGQIEGMLSVNGYTGAVWYHNWHGPFVGMKDLE